MQADERLLAVLIALALAAGSFLFARGGTASAPHHVQGAYLTLREELEAARTDLDFLKKENEKLKALIEKDELVSVPVNRVAEVEAFYGLRFLNGPRLNYITAVDLYHRAEASIEVQMDTHGVGDREAAYKLLGALDENDSALLDQLSLKDTAGKVVWFDWQFGEGFVTEQFSDQNLTHTAQLIAVLSKILLQQHFEILTLAQGSDVFLTREAVLNALAEQAVAKFYAEQALDNGFLKPESSAAISRVSAELANYLEKKSKLLEHLGNRFAVSLMMEDRDTQATILKDLPHSSRELLHEQEAYDFDDLKLSGIEEIFLQESLGAVGYLAWLGKSVEDAEPLATLAGDRFAIFPDGDDSAGMVWELRFKEDRELSDALQEIKERLAKVGGEGRELGLVRLSKSKIRIFNVASSVTAARLKREK